MENWESPLLVGQGEWGRLTWDNCLATSMRRHLSRIRSQKEPRDSLLAVDILLWCSGRNVDDPMESKMQE
ncbi:hypothetical protein TNCT_295351 [Trichonephila clavata]|uniref:Uncharacterized protein n=1 Tax=Trichonephila clavata TaxID=2740835 RepID=A0A8X6I482_TRICU|nr:hypothetical protein TNCT_295351 [Trichonephila clavata]